MRRERIRENQGFVGLEAKLKIGMDGPISWPLYLLLYRLTFLFRLAQPSAERPFVIGFDCEGVDLCRHGTLCIIQLAFPDATYLVDAIQGGVMLINAYKPALESLYHQSHS
ncbi:hypothetical protein COP1_003185 [Malus domestica]